MRPVFCNSGGRATSICQLYSVQHTDVAPYAKHHRVRYREPETKTAGRTPVTYP